MSKIKRLEFIDFWRGIVLITMVIFHFFAVFEYYGLVSVGLYGGSQTFFTELLLVLGGFTRISFIIISAFVTRYVFVRRRDKSVFWLSAALMTWKRAFVVGLVACGVTFVSFVFVAQAPVYFGILHYLALTIFIVPLLDRSKWLPVLVFIFSLFGFWIIKQPVAFWDIIPDSIRILLGNPDNIISIDYFGLLRWLPYSAAVWCLIDPMVFLFSKIKIIINIPVIRWLGRKTLLLYVAHLAILFALVQIIVVLKR